MSRRPLPAAAKPSQSFRWPKLLLGYPVAAFTVIAVGLSALALGALTSDQQFERGLEMALSQTPSTKVAHGMRNTPANEPVAGSEAYWLAAPGGLQLQPATWQGRALTNGDQFLFGGGEAQRILEVTDVRQLPASPGAPTVDKTPAGLLLVTLRDVATPNATPVKMLVDSDAPLAGLTPLARVPQRDL